MRWTTLSVVVLLVVAGCSGGESSVPGTAPTSGIDALVAKAPVAADLPAGSTMARIRQRGELLVGGSLDAPLLSQQDPGTGRLTGFDADLGKLLAKYILGEPKTRLVTATSETREPLLANGTVDVVLQTYTITPQRAERVAFAGPYYSSGQAIAVRRGTGGIAKPADLAGHKVIAGANTPSIAAVKAAAPTAEIVEFGSDPECLTALRQGRGEAYVQDQALLIADAAQDKDLQLVGEPFTTDPYGIGLKHGDDQFKQFVNDWLREIQKSGLWQDVWRGSIGTVVAGDPPAPPVIGSAQGS
ncbi:glutamate ABC transporter substrate-binding protein [Umezawaea tangerina]|uniref:Glutamate transport system substrate-binding protein n=1 Tax=Umezawaea tangerina TaxID=84725 RepID=A0A2T0SSN1_9PSEU|nr:glutamate ABC transporter substrate-binding protein [Umezawaea tangerina]PRY36406.1 glutamate transport system substrate-binding protein [Umezawaea tangerina]